MKVNKNWHKSFFKKSFFNPGMPEAKRRAPEEAGFIARSLGLKKGQALLDLCCGSGRHSVELAKKGVSVTGYDFSKEYLADAREAAKKAGIKIDFIRGDMRELKFKNGFDAVICMWTSFGYFNKAGNLKVLLGVSGALKPGGRFLLDVVNKDRLKANLQPKTWDICEDGTIRLEERCFEKKYGIIQNRWIKIRPGGPARESSFRHFVFNRADISALMKKAGLKPVRFWGGFDSSSHKKTSNRLITLAVKM